MSGVFTVASAVVGAIVAFAVIMLYGRRVRARAAQLYSEAEQESRRVLAAAQQEA